MHPCLGRPGPEPRSPTPSARHCHHMCHKTTVLSQCLLVWEQHAGINALDMGAAMWCNFRVNGCAGRKINVDETVGHTIYLLLISLFLVKSHKRLRYCKREEVFSQDYRDKNSTTKGLYIAIAVLHNTVRLAFTFTGGHPQPWVVLESMWRHWLAAFMNVLGSIGL